MLDRGLRYCSGPEWLQGKPAYATAGCWRLRAPTARPRPPACWPGCWRTRGSTPGFLIGGVPLDFGLSARLGSAPFFVVEADEYDTAFFDKRSKFVHYGPRTLILNNLEFDHADIFDDLAQIQRQFHHLVRTVPGSGLIVHPGADAGHGRGPGDGLLDAARDLRRGTATGPPS